MNYDQIKKIIESCHLNFLIGSGASMPFLSTLGDIEETLTELSEEKDSDRKTVVDALIKKYYFDTAIKGNLEIENSKPKELIETKCVYKEFVSSINTILNRRKTNLVSKQVNLFTTNMDLFLEYTIEELQIPYNDGFFGRLNTVFGTENFHNRILKTSTHYEYQSEIPLFNIFKLHGSVNWKLKANKITFDTNLSILKDIDNIDIKDDDFLPLEREDDGEWDIYSIEELLEKDITKKPVHSMFLKAYDKLVMINPTKQKFETTTRDLTFYELLRMYSNHLERENSVLFVFGFSFADEHIREITKRVAASNPTLLIIIFAYSKLSKKTIEEEIPQTHNIKIIYNEENKVKYSLSEINKRFFSKLADELTNDKTK